jgi:hypothetical protein
LQDAPFVSLMPWMLLLSSVQSELLSVQAELFDRLEQSELYVLSELFELCDSFELSESFDLVEPALSELSEKVERR